MALQRLLASGAAALRRSQVGRIERSEGGPCRVHRRGVR